ncbi:hypothetical protein ACVOMT_03105 [Sphingomonas panni]
MVGQEAERARRGIAEPGGERGMERIAEILVAQPAVDGKTGQRADVDGKVDEVQRHGVTCGQSSRPWTTRRKPAWTPAGQ